MSRPPTLTRRAFLALAAGLAGGAVLPLPGVRAQGDWSEEAPIAARIRADLETYIGGRGMALDFRCIDRSQAERFRIQINADSLMPVASCFKAFAGLYYYLNTPPDVWNDSAGTPLYRMTVYSDNGATGVVLADVAGRIPGPDNAIVKFNDFLRGTMGLTSGLHTWNHEGSPTVGMADPRFAPSAASGRVVRVRGSEYQVDNVFTASDLARGYDFMLRGQHFTHSEAFRQAARAATILLSIPANVSPIERAYPPGYTGKDGVLPADMIATGRVINDAGVLRSGGNAFIVAFMSAGEGDVAALNTLAEVVRQIEVYNAAAAVPPASGV
jgi:hypothetical protein